MKTIGVIGIVLVILLSGCTELKNEQEDESISGTLLHIDLYDIPYWMGKGGYSVISMDIKCDQVYENAFDAHTENDSWINTFNFKVSSFGENINYTKLIEYVESNITVYYEAKNGHSYYRHIEQEDENEIRSNSSTPNNQVQFKLPDVLSTKRNKEQQV